jgi:hypothetical protein
MKKTTALLLTAILFFFADFAHARSKPKREGYVTSKTCTTKAGYNGSEVNGIKEQQISVKNQTTQIIQGVCIKSDSEGISPGCKIKFFSDQTVIIFTPSGRPIIGGVYKTTPKEDFFEIIWPDLPGCKSCIEFNRVKLTALLAIEPLLESGLPAKGHLFRILPRL